MRPGRSCRGIDENFSFDMTGRETVEAVTELGQTDRCLDELRPHNDHHVGPCSAEGFSDVFSQR